MKKILSIIIVCSAILFSIIAHGVPVGLPSCTDRCPVGLTNCGNTCWMNAALQCLFIMDDLTTTLEKLHPKDALLSSYLEVVQAVQTQTTLNEKLINLKCYAYSELQDAISKKELKKKKDETVDQYIQRCKTQNFSEQLDADEFIKKMSERLADENVSLITNPYVTSQSGFLYADIIATFAGSLTEYLIFAAHGLQKQEVISVENITIQNMQYSLIGVVSKSGSTSGGHYVAFVKKNTQWYECDDSTITQKDLLAAESFTPYVLIYKRKDTTVENLTHLAESLQELAQKSQ